MCPHCDEELTDLNWSADVREWGNCDTDGDNRDTANSDLTGDILYECPECQRTVNPDNLTNTDDEEEEDTPSVVTEAAAENRREVKKSFDPRVFCNYSRQQNIEVINCSNKRCNHMFITTRDKICPKCSLDNSMSNIINV